MALLKFRALLTLDPSSADRPGGASPTATLRLGICDPHLAEHRLGYFSALVTSFDGEPLQFGERHRIITLATANPDAVRYLTPGEPFEVWRGHCLGHGTITRRVF